MGPRKQFNYYARLPVRIVDLATKVQKAMESEKVNVELVMNTYFRQYWEDFKVFWWQRTGEMLDWRTFALAPHNAHWFMSWVFAQHPEVAETVKEALIKGGWYQEKDFARGGSHGHKA